MNNKYQAFAERWNLEVENLATIWTLDLDLDLQRYIIIIYVEFLQFNHGRE